MEYCINKVGCKAVIAAHTFKSQDYYELLNHIAPEISTSEPGKLKNEFVPSLKNIITISNEKLR